MKMETMASYGMDGYPKLCRDQRRRVLWRVRRYRRVTQDLDFDL